jgi:hypothetical protein
MPLVTRYCSLKLIDCYDGYNKKCRELSTTLNDEDILSITKTELFDYMGSPGEYHDAIAEGLSESTKPMAFANNKEFTAVDFRKDTKRDKNCYSELKDDKHFNIWNRGFVSTAYTHHTQLVLDENYKPKTETEKEVFHEMQFFMYSVFEKS